ncbi:efflux RND transporter periplasmic adaptor subunit [uncultured Enterovirga sp.]|uniref:efflux RND transporter periplasmic adaptor subunit n=1 Tax=uncultured Enterovirga sp. TaxID=2026352 RepID=UPI0035CA94B2
MPSLVPHLAAVIFVSALAACGEPSSQAAKAGPPPRPVLVKTVAYADRVTERSLVGTIRPRVETDLGFRVAGKVARRLVGVGDVVRGGQQLASLDEVDLGLQTEQAEAEARAAAASLRQAEADLVRTESLTSKGYSASASLDRQQAVTEEARGRLLRAERAMTLARNARSYAVLTADADGVVTATSIEPGQVVTAGQAAIRLARTNEKEAVVSIPESLLSLAKGRAAMTLWSNPGTRYEAKLREFAPSADPATRTYLARFSIPAADETVQIGMTATVTIAVPDRERVARLPLSALFNQGTGPAVWTVGTEGRPTLKPVDVAAYEAVEVLIGSGVEDGDRVVALGVSKLDPGQIVRVIEALQF